MRKKLKLLFIGIVLLILIFMYTIVKPYYIFATKTLHISPLEALLGTGKIKKFNNKVNILVLGIAGGNHDGPLLSDSIIVMQYDFAKNTLVSLGIPRDIWSETLKDKINSAYAYGEAKRQGGGLILAKSEIGAVIGQPIQYGVVISFEKFKTLINKLDGIDVNVEHSFTDPKFPIEGKENDECNGDLDYECRYESVSFDAGLIHMNGETALKFVRSRYSDGDEGSDFARSKRQQLVINSLKEKLLKLVKDDLNAYSLKKTENFYAELDKLIERDITNNELALLGRNIFSNKDFTQIQVHLVRDWFEVPDYTNYEGRYVLIPINGNVDSLHTKIYCLLEKKDDSQCTKGI